MSNRFKYIMALVAAVLVGGGTACAAKSSEPAVVSWATWEPGGTVPSAQKTQEYLSIAARVLGVESTDTMTVERGTFHDLYPAGEADRSGSCVLLRKDACRVPAPAAAAGGRIEERAIPGGTLDCFVNLGVVIEEHSGRVVAIVADNGKRQATPCSPDLVRFGTEVSFRPVDADQVRATATDVLGTAWAMFENPATAAEVILRPRLVQGSWVAVPRGVRLEASGEWKLQWVVTIRGAQRTGGMHMNKNSFFCLIADDDLEFVQGGWFK